FPILGRIRNSRVRVKDTTFSSRQYGTRESKEVAVEGRVQFDLLQVMQIDYKLSSYSLNSDSAHFLSEQVLEARAGFYKKPIATIDFASLHPSIMMTYNLCYCTLVTPEDVRKLNLPLESVNKTLGKHLLNQTCR
ncbi:hypothetical protein S245_048052, partial [Arachis hypogaea]